MASSEVLKQKEEKVNSLAEKLKNAKIILLADYRGINVADVTALRANLRDAKADYKVIKNNIIKRALDSNGQSGLDDLLEVVKEPGKNVTNELHKVRRNMQKRYKVE